MKSKDHPEGLGSVDSEPEKKPKDQKVGSEKNKPKKWQDYMIGLASVNPDAETANIGYKVNTEIGLVVLSETREVVKAEKDVGLELDLLGQNSQFLEVIAGSLINEIETTVIDGNFNVDTSEFEESLADIVHSTDMVVLDSMTSDTSFTEQSEMFNLNNLMSAKNSGGSEGNLNLSKKRLPKVSNDLLAAYVHRGRIYVVHRGGAHLYHVSETISRYTQWHIDQNIFRIPTSSTSINENRKLKVDSVSRNFDKGRLVFLSQGIFSTRYSKLNDILYEPALSAQEHADLIREEAINQGADKGQIIIVKPYETFSLGSLSNLGNVEGPSEPMERIPRRKDTVPYVIIGSADVQEQEKPTKSKKQKIYPPPEKIEPKKPEESGESYLLASSKIEDIAEIVLGNVLKKMEEVEQRVYQTLDDRISNMRSELTGLMSGEIQALLNRVEQYSSSEMKEEGLEDIKSSLGTLANDINQGIDQGLDDIRSSAVNEVSQGTINLRMMMGSDGDQEGTPTQPPVACKDEEDVTLRNINIGKKDDVLPPEETDFIEGIEVPIQGIYKKSLLKYKLGIPALLLVAAVTAYFALDGLKEDKVSTQRTSIRTNAEDAQDDSSVAVAKSKTKSSAKFPVYDMSDKVLTANAGKRVDAGVDIGTIVEESLGPVEPAMVETKPEPVQLYVLGEVETARENFNYGRKLFHKADKKHLIDGYKQALSYFVKAVEMQPGNASALFWKGRTEYQITKLTQGEEQKRFAQAGITSYERCSIKPNCKKHEKTIKRNMHFLRRSSK